MARRKLHLTRGGALLAILHPDGRRLVTDHQAVEGTCETTTAFEPLWPLFEREVELLDVDSEAENNEWSEIWAELLGPGLFVETLDGSERIEVQWSTSRTGARGGFRCIIVRGPCFDARASWPELAGRDMTRTVRKTVVIGGAVRERL